MVVCVYLWLNCVNQSEPTHHKQSDSSRVQPPDVGGWKRWKRDSVSGWSPSLALLTRARAPVPPTLAWWIGPCVRGLLHVLLWHISASHFYRQSMQMTSFPFSFSFFTVSPAVDAFSTVTVRGCGRRHNLHLLIITADNPEQKEAQRWPRRWSVLQTCSSDQKCLKRKTRDDCWKEPVCVDTPRSISVPPPPPPSLPGFKINSLLSQKSVMSQLIESSCKVYLAQSLLFLYVCIDAEKWTRMQSSRVGCIEKLQ